MRLTEDQWITLLTTMTKHAVIGWEDRSAKERLDIVADLREKLFRVFDHLPYEQDPQALPSMMDFFRDRALEHIIAHMRRSQIYRGAPDSILLENISEQVIADVAMHLLNLTLLAFEFLPQDKTLMAMLDSINEWDLDAELFDLVNNEED